MTEPTIADAKALIERMKTIRPTCAFDAQESYEWFTRRTEESRVRMRELGWEEDACTASVRLRCYECRDTIKYPWAGKLDAERVLAHMKRPDRNNIAWCLDELEALL